MVNKFDEQEITALKAIGQNILTQDNRCTADPIFCIQGRKRIYGMDPSYVDETVWIDEEGNEIDVAKCRQEAKDLRGQLPVTEDEKAEYAKQYEKEDELTDYEWAEKQEWTNTAYVDRWETIQMCFTEDGCNRHIKMNQHNYARPYKEIRIYVDHLYRNPEMVLIRNMLMAFAKGELQLVHTPLPESGEND